MAERYLLLFDVDELLVTVNEKGERSRTRGSWEAISQINGRTDAVQSLVTPLPKDEASAKVGDVTGVGLVRYLDLEVGGYGDDADDRAALVSLARQRARDSYGSEFTVAVVVLGTVDEVARVRGAADVVVAVATEDASESTVDELRATGAGLVVTRLVDVVQLVLGTHVG
jgi:phosphoglycolate phosphatase